MYFHSARNISFHPTLSPPELPYPQTLVGQALLLNHGSGTCTRLSFPPPFWLQLQNQATGLEMFPCEAGFLIKYGSESIEFAAAVMRSSLLGLEMIYRQSWWLYLHIPLLYLRGVRARWENHGEISIVEHKHYATGDNYCLDFRGKTLWVWGEHLDYWFFKPMLKKYQSRNSAANSM